MKRYPAVPGVDDADPAFFEAGHLWVQELVAGELIRVQVQASGALRVGTRRRVLDPDEVPLRYRHAVQSIRDDLDVDALRAAVADVESVVFFGVATQYDGVPYDWARTPSVLWVDAWDADREGFLAVDAAERALAEFGLEPVNVLEKEVHVRDYDAASPSMPRSAWYDGPVAGVVLRKKTGERLAIPNPAIERGVERAVSPTAATADAPTDAPTDATAAADRAATRERFERVVQSVAARDRPISFDTVYDRFLAAIYRETHDWLLSGDDGAGFDLGAFRSAVSRRTSEFLDER
ncbi:hypothetical protein G9C85_02170 [Halorubellus sp. JP-L1]|uniref:hypothetical protein n=1 Tax=Halorubellus sp. JP-L1 TaxID=2715753 RepID=UPI00140C1AC9|nr:hypothetical protein [Halorubellus sp. JP-L1]NHN40442.1 hypothetical protein [Halorubellus sp. JP-L1]